MIYFLSDAHLGSRNIVDFKAHQQRLIDLLNDLAKDAEAIYMLGDMLDFWMEYFISDPSKRRFSPFFKALRQLESKGIRVHYFLGAHDRWTYGGLKALTKAEIHEYAFTIRIKGKQVYLHYGEGLHPYDWYRSYSVADQRRVRREMNKEKYYSNQALLTFFRCLPPSLGNAIGYRWAQGRLADERALPKQFMGTKEPQIIFAKDEEKHGNHRDYYIFGHRHLAQDFALSDTTRVIMLGDCFEQWTYARMDDTGEITLCTF